MKLHVFQHVAFEGLGAIQEWIDLNQHQVTFSRFYEPNPAPIDCESTDMLIILGGPMSIHDEAQLPWLVHEKQWLAEAIDSGLVILGICLGAQLITEALGGQVHKMPAKEIGWFNIKRSPDVQSSFFDSTDELTVLHWHGEQCTLPKQAERIFYNDACQNQGYVAKDRILALQCHLEFNELSIESILKHCHEELSAKPGHYIQPSEQILKLYEALGPTCHKHLFNVLDQLQSIAGS